MLEVQARLRARGPYPSALDAQGRPNPEKQAKRAAYLKENEKAFLKDFLDDFVRRTALLPRHQGMDAKQKAELRSVYEEVLVDCMAINLGTCRTRLTYKAIERISSKLAKSSELGLTPDLMLVSDHLASGLADRDNEFYGNDTRIGEKYRILGSVLPNNQRKTAGVVYAQDAIVHDTRSYFMTAHRVVDDNEDAVGAVLLGLEIDENFIKEEAKALNRNVTYISGRSSKALKTSLAGPALTQLQQKLPGSKAASEAHLIETDNVVGQYIPLKGYRSKDVTGVVLTRSRKEALSMVNTFQGLIPVLGIIFFILGSMLLFYAIHSHIDALEQVDSGIHEVISGESDYEFNFDYKDERLSSMAQSLNLMVAVLVGRDVDDDERHGDSAWMQSFLDEGEDWNDGADGSEQEPQGVSTPQAVVTSANPEAQPEPAAVAPAPASSVPSPSPISGADAELAIEPAESYYRRIYSEFTQGRKEAGDETISYVRFVEKVVRQERVLRNQLACRMVRFRVVQRDDGPALLPVKID